MDRVGHTSDFFGFVTVVFASWMWDRWSLYRQRRLVNGYVRPLHYACFNSDTTLDRVKFIVQEYPHAIQSTDLTGRLPLHCAVGFASAEVVQFLVETYPEAVSVTDCSGKLPLHYACFGGACQQVVQLLIDCYKGVEENCNGLGVVDAYGRIPLHYAAHGRVTTNTLRYLLERYPEGTYVADKSRMLPLHIASNLSRSCIENTCLWVQYGPFAVIKRNDNGNTPFELALRRSRRGLVTVFLSETHGEIERVLKKTFENIAGTHLRLPDLVIANVWSFARPHVRVSLPVERQRTQPVGANDFARWEHLRL